MNAATLRATELASSPAHAISAIKCGAVIRPPLLTVSCLEIDAGVNRDCSVAHSVGNTTEVRVVDVHVGVFPLRRVQRVCCVGAEREAHAFADLDALGQ